MCNVFIFLSISKFCNKEFTTVPNRYFCYCGKKENPEFDPWLPPHSCGDLCGRTLPCGHVCNERCHPGPCPPCPRIVTITCPCGKTKRTVRCSLQHQESPENLCSLPCLKWLPCGKHRCRHKCHYGPCPDCPFTIHQTCFCGSESRDVPCGKDVPEHYSCGKICGKPLACGHHVCSLPCHEGACPPCPTLPPRSCFCGKKRSVRARGFIRVRSAVHRSHAVLPPNLRPPAALRASLSPPVPPPAVPSLRAGRAEVLPLRRHAEALQVQRGLSLLLALHSLQILRNPPLQPPLLRRPSRSLHAGRSAALLLSSRSAINRSRVGDTRASCPAIRANVRRVFSPLRSPASAAPLP